MVRNYGIACFALGAVLTVAGITCLWITSHSVEKSNGVFVALGSSVIRLHDVGLLGDFGTFRGLWSLLGLSCLGAAVCLLLTWWFRNASVGLGFLVCAILSLIVAAPLGLFLLVL
jgi:hypothetical protein